MTYEVTDLINLSVAFICEIFYMILFFSNNQIDIPPLKIPKVLYPFSLIFLAQRHKKPFMYSSQSLKSVEIMPVNLELAGSTSSRISSGRAR